MKGLKKVSCAVLAMAMAATMTGCDASWIAKSGDLKIPAGVYAATMLQNCTYGYAYGGADYLDETTEEEFVTYAKDYTIEILSYLKKAEELGISLDEEEMAELETAIDADWETYGNLYEANRISKDSLELSYEASLLSEKVFKAIYGEGGEKEVSEEELRTIFSEDYLKAGVILFNKPVEEELAEDATEEEKTAAKEEYETALKEVEEQVAYWIEQATNLMGSGSTFNEVMIAYEIENDPYTTEEIDTTSSRYTYINKNDTDLPEEVITRAATEEGIVPGGGIALLTVAAKVKALLPEYSGDAKTGVQIILRALEEPIRQIAANAGVEGSVIVENVKANAGKSAGYGYDALNDEYCDMIERGIIDPTKVTRSALQNAASVAAMVLTTESLVADIPQPEPAAPAGGAGMGGMY